MDAMLAGWLEDIQTVGLMLDNWQASYQARNPDGKLNGWSHGWLADCMLE